MSICVITLVFDHFLCGRRDLIFARTLAGCGRDDGGDLFWAATPLGSSLEVA